MQRVGQFVPADRHRHEGKGISVPLVRPDRLFRVSRSVNVCVSLENLPPSQSDFLHYPATFFNLLSHFFEYFFNILLRCYVCGIFYMHFFIVGDFSFITLSFLVYISYVSCTRSFISGKNDIFNIWN